MVGGDWFTKRDDEESGPLSEHQIKAILFSTLDLSGLRIRQGNSVWVDAQVVLEKFITLERNGIYLLSQANVIGPFTIARANELLESGLKASSYRFGSTGEWRAFGDRRILSFEVPSSAESKSFPAISPDADVHGKAVSVAEASSLFFRFNGHVLGPLTKEKANELVSRGRITRLHEVSGDGVSWRSAKDFEGFFPSLKSNDRQRSDDESNANPPAMSEFKTGLNYPFSDSIFKARNWFSRMRRNVSIFDTTRFSISRGKEIVGRKSVSYLNSFRDFIVSCFAIGFGVFVLLPTVICVIALAIGGVRLVDNVKDFVSSIDQDQWTARIDLLFVRTDETNAEDGWLYSFSKHPQPILRHLSAGDDVWFLKDFKLSDDSDIRKRELYFILSPEGVRTVVLKSEERVDDSSGETGYESGWIRFVDQSINDPFVVSALSTEEGLKLILTYEFHELIAGSSSLSINQKRRTIIDLKVDEANGSCSWVATESRTGQAGNYPIESTNLTFQGEGFRFKASK